MNRREHRIGPGAASLLLVIVVVSLSVLSLLALIDARADHNLTRRSIDFATSQYTAAANAEYTLAALDEILVSCAENAQDGTSFWEMLANRLPEGMTLDGRTILWEETTDRGGTLLCAVEVQEPGSDVRCIWQEHAFLGAAE